MVALPDLGRSWLVFRRQAFHRIGNTTLCEPQIVIWRSRTLVIGETEFVQCTVQKYSCKIPCERPPRPVRAMHAGGKADNEKFGSLIPKSGYRASVIIGVPGFHYVEKSCQPIATAAIGGEPWLAAYRGIARYFL